MLRSQLIAQIQAEVTELKPGDVERMVNTVFDEIIKALENGDRVELRGFGAFSVRRREARQGRNPRTGATVKVAAKAVPFFKPGKELRNAVDAPREPPKTVRRKAK